MKHEARRLYVKIFSRYYLAVALALMAAVIAIYAPLSLKIEMKHLLLPHSVNSVYIYRVWLGVGRYTICVHSVANLTLVVLPHDGRGVNYSVTGLAQKTHCVRGIYVSSPTILAVIVRVPPYTTRVGELVITRTGW